MRTIVFLGPTLSVAQAREVLDADYRCPVSQGEVYQAALEKPWGIAIVDGYFERLPAVWHKEILWAMSRGIHVFGASSMGALRAFELAPFGMIGVGKIFEAFESGELTDDDEVTIVHGDVDSGYRALSVAMVDIRATLAKAQELGVIGGDTCQRLLALAKALHYPNRSYQQLQQSALADGVAPQELTRLREFLVDGRVHRKREDALALLRAIGEHQQHDAGPKRVDYHFEHTDVWEQVVRRSAVSRNANAPEPVARGELLAELRIDPDVQRELEGASLARALALEVADRGGLEVDRELLQRTVEAFRRERGLLDPESVERWLAQHALDKPGFLELMLREARIRLVQTQRMADAEHQLLDALRLRGDFPALIRRAQAKRQLLAAHGLSNTGLESTELSEAQLLTWYRGRCAGARGVSDEQLARAAGYVDRPSFVQALVREYHYVSHATVVEPNGDQPCNSSEKTW